LVATKTSNSSKLSSASKANPSWPAKPKPSARLKRKTSDPLVNDDQLLRYSRHILLDDIGIEGQQRLLDSHVLVVGAGGLGSPVAMYLAASGVGHITLADPDKVDLTNLQRQIAHTTERVGQTKVASAAKALQAINPEVRLTLLEKQLQSDDLDQLLPDIDAVVDCCDNFATRQAVNAACVKHRVPLVSGAALRMDGQIAVFDPRDQLSPCYACIFPPTPAPPETLCSTMGVLAPLVGVIGTMQAMETVKLLSGMGSRLVGKLLMLDGRDMAWREMHITRHASCPVCSTGHALAVS
jgi:molybdopterin/thiamine biosynthesis adenylyltransferase